MASNKSNVVQFGPALMAYTVDRLADVNAQLKKLNDEAAELKARLMADGHDEIVGSLHKAVIVHSIRETVDSAKVRDEYPEVYAACSKATPVHSIRIYGL